MLPRCLSPSVNRAFNYSLLECRWINPAIFSYQVCEWTCQSSPRGQPSTFCLSGCKFDGFLVSTSHTVNEVRDVIICIWTRFRSILNSNVFSFLLLLIPSIFHSYACDEFVINDTKSGDIQRVREIMLERENRWAFRYKPQHSPGDSN